MASRTGDKRLIAAPAESMSVGLVLTLMLVGLLLGGCGSNSSGSVGSAATDSPTQATAHSGPAGSTRAGNSSDTGVDPQQQESATQQHSESHGTLASPTGQGQKHGPRIAQPKGPREQSPTPADVAKLTVADMTLSSPSLPAGSGGPVPLSAAYSCDGMGEWPSLSWSGVPAGTAELILYAMNVQPVEEKLFVDWALAGLNPALTGIEAGQLPKGASVGTNSFGKRGYEVCPEGSEIYIFAIYALPRALTPRPGFDARQLRKEVLDVSGNVGLFPVSYTRD